MGVNMEVAQVKAVRVVPVDRAVSSVVVFTFVVIVIVAVGVF